MFILRSNLRLFSVTVFIPCNQERCCFFKKGGSSNSLWSNRSYINRLFALGTDAIITNYFQALWELNNSVMHHWTFSCFIADGFRGPSAHSNVFNKPPSPSPKGSEALEYSFSTTGAFPWFPWIKERSHCLLYPPWKEMLLCVKCKKSLWVSGKQEKDYLDLENF